MRRFTAVIGSATSFLPVPWPPPRQDPRFSADFTGIYGVGNRELKIFYLRSVNTSIAAPITATVRPPAPRWPGTIIGVSKGHWLNGARVTLLVRDFEAHMAAPTNSPPPSVPARSTPAPQTAKGPGATAPKAPANAGAM